MPIIILHNVIDLGRIVYDFWPKTGLDNESIHLFNFSHDIRGKNPGYRNRGTRTHSVI